MRKNLLLCSSLIFFSTLVFGQQNTWSRFAGNTVENQRERAHMPQTYKLIKLDVEAIKDQLAQAPLRSSNAQSISVKFPNLNGTYDTYKIVETPTMHPDLQAKYPEIRSYSGYKIDEPHIRIKFSLSPNFGLNATIRSVEGLQYLESFSTDNQLYILYNRNDVDHQHTFNCQHDGDDFQGITESIDELLLKNVIDGKMRKYRLAMATTTEYTAYIANQAGVGSGTDAQKKAAVMEALNLAVTRLNEVYESELSLRFELIANNDALIHINSDSYNINDTQGMLAVNQSVIDNVIGNVNYDIGHVVFKASPGVGDGIARLNSVCVNQFKAMGVTGFHTPVGDPFVIDFVAHEMGHQFGATHTQNNSCNVSLGTSAEPGSGSTIMGYAGICPPNVQQRSDAYFHAVSLRQMYNKISGNADCSVKTDTGNNEPSADAGPDRTIPKETPFVLTGIGMDPDEDAVTYNWEQLDVQQNEMPPRPTNATGPMFRSKWATTSPERYFPMLPTVIEGYNPTINTPLNPRAWEKLPAVSRQLNFSLTVRDNNPVGGQSKRDDVRLTVTADAGPFVVTSQASAEVWNLGESKTITWNVANTNAAPVSTQNVKILISTDGGVTFPHVLVESTPNNGSYTFTVPPGLGTSTNARIMVRAVDNVFFNVNTAFFTINSTLAVDDLNDNNSFAVYPNPSKGVFTIQFMAKSNEFSYSVYSMDGKQIVNKSVKNIQGKVNQQLDLSHLPSGTYLLQINNGSEKISKKLIINK